MREHIRRGTLSFEEFMRTAVFGLKCRQVIKNMVASWRQLQLPLSSTAMGSESYPIQLNLSRFVSFFRALE